MKQQFVLFRRDKSTRCGKGVFYLEDTVTGKKTSLRTKDRVTAERLLHAHREAHQQPIINLHIARAYIAASDPAMLTRTWRHVLEGIIKTKQGDTAHRWTTAAKDKALKAILDKPIIETLSDDFLNVMATGKVSTNVYLRRLHNFALDMNWLLAPILVKKKWPAPVYKPKRAITFEEHQKIIAQEHNPERSAFYELAWHTDASQSDLAGLHAEDIDWETNVIGYERMKIAGRAKVPPQITMGPELQKLLRLLPTSGYLFPYLRTVRSGDRATKFKQRCETVSVEGVTLHSYRYAWAERAKVCGDPERFAQEALCHNSKAVHRAYAKKAQVQLPSLEEYERRQNKKKMVSF